jgi:hypothetical protein
VEIRLATAEDLPGAYALADSISAEQGALLRGSPVVLVAMDGGVVAGYCGVDMHRVEGAGPYITSLGVQSKYRRSGLMTQFCRWVSDNLSSDGEFCGHVPEGSAAEAVVVEGFEVVGAPAKPPLVFYRCRPRIV